MPTAPPTSTVRLTDQALVAVHMGRSLAAGRRATVAHLLAGILGESEGQAGRRIRRQAGGEPAVRLSTHAGVHAPGLPTLSNALIALPISDVPAWTEDLLRAALRTGGSELHDLLADIGLEMAVVPADPMVDPDEDAQETFGRGTFTARGFSAVADLAVAHARAAGATSATLLPHLDIQPEERMAMARLPEVPLQRVVDRALALGRDHITLAELSTALLSVALEDLKLDSRDVPKP